MGKRERELEQRQRRQDKDERRRERRVNGPRELEVATADSVQRGMPSIEEAMRNLELRAQGGSHAALIPSKLFVGGVANDVNEAVLREVFASHADIAEVSIAVDRATRAPRGFAFVTLRDRRDTNRVIDATNGLELHGRTLAVRIATER